MKKSLVLLCLIKCVLCGVQRNLEDTNGITKEEAVIHSDKIKNITLSSNEAIILQNNITSGRRINNENLNSSQKYNNALYDNHNNFHGYARGIVNSFNGDNCPTGYHRSYNRKFCRPDE
ncbi:hypothetical protein O3G_MSEX011841 [Manduca sexta]|uniref:Uncharacterized protein n=1 Tax=Manduca sexta TaxID=7130 RepID=A0A921ZLW2_MANSE|nr:hypothetical protein O3G_MSEX011841 [Manduca sexta]